MVDLHVHSSKSDGSYTPLELVDYALEKGLTAFALTDHDTTAGIDEAISYAKGKPLEVIPGVELSTEYEGRDIHIVGLYVNQNAPGFADYIKKFQDSRKLRNEKICEKLKEHGIDITLEELEHEFPGAIITRGLYAKYMLKKGYIKSMQEAFDRYIGDHGPCFVAREKITPEQAVGFIKSAGGLSILAHPPLYRMSRAKLEILVGRLKAAGLDGIEAKYTTYSSTEEREMKEIAAKFDLAISGGSDFHGTTKPKTDLGIGYGNLYIHESVLSHLKSLLDTSIQQGAHTYDR